MASVISAGLTSGTSLNLTGDTSGQLQFQTNGTTAAMTIDTSQNVGIGTSSPNSYAGFKTLAINGSTGGVVDFVNNGTREGSIYNAGTSFNIKTFTASPILFATNNAATQLTLDTSGNLGLGVTPSAWFSSGYKTFQNGWASFFAGAANTSSGTFGYNTYTDTSGVSRYIGSSYATFYEQYQGQHAWYKAPSGTAGAAITWTQAMTLDASGNLLVGLTSATSGGGVLQVSNGITFPATQSASSDANTLDDYEEGTFTVTFTAASGGQPTISYNYNGGRYIKVGKLVYYTIRLGVASVSGGTSSLCLVSGLPFTAVNNTNSYPGALANYKSAWATLSPTYGRILASATDIELYASATTGESNIQTNYLANGCNLILTGCYEATS